VRIFALSANFIDFSKVSAPASFPSSVFYPNSEISFFKISAYKKFKCKALLLDK